MKQRMSRRALAALPLLAGLALAAPAVAQNAAGGGEKFRIGAIFPLTGFGAPTGYSSEVGLKLAVKEINAAGGIMGRQVETIESDDQFNPSQSVALAKKLIYSDKVDAIVGPQASQLALAVAPVMAEGNVAYFSAGATSLLTPQVGPTGFSMQIAPEEQAVAIVDWAVNIMHAKSIAYIGDNSPNSSTMMQRFKTYAPEKGLRITSVDTFDQNTPDLTPQLLNARRGNPDVLLFQGATTPDMANGLKGLGDIGWDVPVGGSLTMTALYGPIAKAAGPAAERITAALQIKSFTYCSNDPLGSSEYSKFLDKLKAEDPTHYNQLAFALAAWSYDAVLYIKAAAEGAGSTEGRKMAAWVETHPGAVNAVTGPGHASATTHFLANAQTMVMVEHPGQIRSDGLMKRAGC